MFLKIRSLCQSNADNLYKKQKCGHRLMLPLSPQVSDYYGYNSIINCEGKRIRRMRRTQASVEKILHSRMKSPVFSRSASSRKSRIQRKEFLTGCDRSSAKNNQINNNIERKELRTEPPSEFVRIGSRSRVSKLAGSASVNPQTKDVRSTMGQYYVGLSSAFEEKSAKKQQGNRPASKVSIKDLQRHSSGQIQNNFKHISINTSKRTLKKTQKSQECILPFQIENRKSKKNSKELPEKKVLLKKRESNLRESPQASQKLSKMSVRSKQESFVSLEANKIQINDIKKNHVKFQENQSSMSQSNKVQNSAQISKKSSIQINVSSQPSALSNKESNISAFAQKLKSKIKQRKEKSTISIKQNESEVKVEKMANSQSKKTNMTKKLTETTESNQSPEDSYEMRSGKKANEMTPKANKKSPETETNNSKLDKQQSHSSSSSSLSQSSNNDSLKQSSKNQSFKRSQKPSQRQSLKVIKKKSISSYTFNDVVQNIEQHQIRLGSLFFFVDSTKSLYSSPLKFQRYERLCFLILKKYVFQQNRLIKCLKGGENCLVLTNAQIPSQVLKKHINRQQVRDRLNTFIEQSKEISEALKTQYNSIAHKYPKDKYIKTQGILDNFSPQIMRLMMEQLTKLYQQLQAEDIENDIIDSNQQRIIQIIEIMFLLSQLSGRPVKEFELFDENIGDFEEYYSQNYERIMETAQYFEKYV